MHFSNDFITYLTVMIKPGVEKNYFISYILVAFIFSYLVNKIKICTFLGNCLK